MEIREEGETRDEQPETPAARAAGAAPRARSRLNVGWLLLAAVVFVTAGVVLLLDWAF